MDFFKLVTEGDVIWNSITLDRIHKAGELMRGGGLRPLDARSNAFGLSLRERKSMLKSLREKINVIGTSHRETTSALIVGMKCKTSLIADLPPPKSQTGLCLTSCSTYLTMVVDDEDEDPTLSTLAHKRKGLEADLTPRGNRHRSQNYEDKRPASMPPPDFQTVVIQKDSRGHHPKEPHIGSEQ